MNLDTNKFIKRMFRRVEGVVWDITSGATGLKTDNGVYTIAFDAEGNPQVSVNPFDMSVALPGFAMQTPFEQIVEGDIIVGDTKILGWVVDKKVNSLDVMNFEGRTSNFTPPKVAILGGSGPLVVRNLFNLAGGQSGVASMLPLLAMAGGDKVEKILPFLLLQQAAPAAAGGAAPAANPMAAMLPLLLLKDGLGGKSNGGGIDPMMLMMMAGGGGAMNPMMLLALSGGLGDDTSSAPPSLPAPRSLTPPPLGSLVRG